MDRLLLSVLVATLLLVIFWLFFSKKHAASRRQIGNTIVICGPVGAGKTILFLKVSYLLIMRFSYTLVIWKRAGLACTAFSKG